MLGQVNLFGKNKVDVAIDRIRAFEPPDGYYLAFSGGKDSQAVYHLAKMAGVAFDAHYSVTTVDPPELMKFIKENYPDVQWERPKFNGKPVSMWTLIPEHTVPPTRKVRYCCDVLKEQHGQGRVVITGVRWAESVTRRNTHGLVDIRTKSKKIIDDSLENNRAASLNGRGGLIFNDDNDETRKTVEQCYQKRRTTLNPIIEWDDDEVWEFIKEWAKVPYCSLYDEGFTRLGCIGCPLQGTKGMLRDFERWPRYKELYIKAFDEMIKKHSGITDANGDIPRGGAEKINTYMEWNGHPVLPGMDQGSTPVLTQKNVKWNKDPNVADFESGEAILDSLTYKKPFKASGKETNGDGSADTPVEYRHTDRKQWAGGSEPGWHRNNWNGEQTVDDWVRRPYS